MAELLLRKKLHFAETEQPTAWSTAKWTARPRQGDIVEVFPNGYFAIWATGQTGRGWDREAFALVKLVNVNPSNWTGLRGWETATYTVAPKNRLGLTDGDAEADGDTEGLTLGERLGLTEADALGDSDGLAETPADGDWLGLTLGLTDGLTLGLSDALGDSDGEALGLLLGDWLGLALGEALGDAEGLALLPAPLTYSKAPMGVDIAGTTRS